ncbi:MAG: hypothetical protein ACE5Q6_06845 [Dehalococcoidia bacterium]
MKIRRTTIAMSILAHLLAWAAFLWLVFWPNFYQGTTIVSTGPDGSGGREVPFSASMLEVNGRGVLIPLLVPVALTALGVLTAVNRNYADRRNQALLWITAVLLAVFCGLALFSIGMFYLPATLALILAAVVVTAGPLRNQRRRDRPAR